MQGPVQNEMGTPCSKGKKHFKTGALNPARGPSEMGVGALGGWHVGEAGPGKGYTPRYTFILRITEKTTTTTYIPVRNMN